MLENLEICLEIWKDVREYPDLFSVSNYGRVYSKRSGKTLKNGKSKSGYPVISTRIGGRNGEAICRKIHRWVAECFVDNPDNKPYVNHKDGDKTNNYYENLEWVTNRENTIHAYETGLMVSRGGKESSSAKLNNKDVEYIRENYKPRCKHNGARALANNFGVNHSTISNIVNNKTWN